jgi:hypothetical protein
MKALPRAIGTLLLFLSATLVNESAMAEHRAHKHGHGHGPIVRVGFSYGFPVYTPRYFPAPFYAFPGYAFPAPVYAYPPAVVRYSPPPVYVERTIAPAESVPSQAQNDWYYCAGSQTYYPYARECSGGWQRVPAQPSSR